MQLAWLNKPYEKKPYIRSNTTKQHKRMVAIGYAGDFDVLVTTKMRILEMDVQYPQ